MPVAWLYPEMDGADLRGWLQCVLTLQTLRPSQAKSNTVLHKTFFVTKLS